MKLHQAASTDKTAMQNRSAATVQRLNKPADMMDTRVTASAQVQRQTLSDQSPQAMQLKKHLASLNQAVQRAEDDELVQGKFATAQRAEDEEPMQGKFDTAQRVEEEELIQGRFDTAQCAEDEELLQGKFETAQRVEEEEPLQGKFETVQRVEEEELVQGKFETAQRVEEEEPLQGKFTTVQCAEDEDLLQGKFDTVQRMSEEEPLQAKSADTPPTQLAEQANVKPNNTGLPNQLKAGIESLSGMSMDHVKVHYNSAQPAQLNAHAYAQGSEIHVAPGQEQHLPHEAWHVVQQAQGRVKPTMQMKMGVPVNDDVGLETEADVMGAKALVAVQIKEKGDVGVLALAPSSFVGESNRSDPIAQRTSWSWVDGAWAAQDEDEPQTAQPTRDGDYAWETIDTAVVEDEEEPEPVVYTLTYGAAHGDLHFGGAPTAAKSKWSIPRDAAKTLMEAEMTNRMQDIVTAATAADNGRIAWILVADAAGKIGSAVGVPRVDRFQIQLQADSATGDISYHGFPDEQALHTGLGPSRNNLT